MEDKLEFPKKEPPKYNAAMLRQGMEMESTEHISWRVEKEHYDNFNSVSKSKRDEVLTCFKRGGINIGEIAKMCGLSSKVVGDIIYLNIKVDNIHTLRTESL